MNFKWFEKLIRAVLNPKKAWRFFSFMLYNNFRKRRGTLFIIGLDPNGTFNLMHRGYEKCYGFEANPERFKKLERKYGGYSYIKLYNVAVASYDGEITFNISSNNNGASSSIGNFNAGWNQEYEGEKIEMVKSITVPCINLNNFCNKNGISFIDDYVSDIQGMDLEVLKTLKPMIDNKMIGTITCEVTKNEVGNVYSDLPDNSESGFSDLLDMNYVLIAKGSGVLRDNKFDRLDTEAWEMDCKWKLKLV
jgi:FkbM family methyltransferase